jgi:hypothetical protein
LSGSEEELEDVKPRVKSTAGRGTKRKINAVSRDEEIRILLSIPDEQESVSDSELSEEEVKPTKTTPRQKAMASKLIGTDSKSSTPRAAFSKVRLSSWQPGLRLRQGTKANKSPSKAPKKAVSVRPDRLLPLTSLGPPLLTSSRAYTTGSSSCVHLLSPGPISHVSPTANRSLPFQPRKANVKVESDLSDLSS